MKIAVLGANGRLAAEVARKFRDAGHEVVAITRSGRAKGLGAGIEERAADALDAGRLIAATAGADIVFNGLNPPYDEWAAKALPMARNVMAAARANGFLHLFPGNVYNFGTAIPMAADEMTPQHPDTRKGRIRVEIEQLFETEAREHGVRTAIIRAGDFYGTDGKGVWFDLFMIKDLEKGAFTWPGPWDAPHAFAYLPDLAAVFVALADRRADLAGFDVFHFEGHTLDGNRFKALVEAAVGHPLKSKSVPWWMLRLIAPFQSMLREVVEMEYLWRTPHSLDGRKLQAFLGHVGITDPEVAVRQAIIDQGKLAGPGNGAAQAA